MLYREIIAVCSEIHTKHINTLCGQNVEFVNVKPGGTYSIHRALTGSSNVWLVYTRIFSTWEPNYSSAMAGHVVMGRNANSANGSPTLFTSLNTTEHCFYPTIRDRKNVTRGNYNVLPLTQVPLFYLTTATCHFLRACGQSAEWAALTR
jgi:hypothetical protein